MECSGIGFQRGSIVKELEKWTGGTIGQLNCRESEGV